MPDPVLDPELAERERRLLLGDLEALHAPGTLPKRPRFGGRTWGDLGVCLRQAPVWTLLPGLMGWFHGGRARLAGLVAQAVLVMAALLGPGPATFLLSCGYAMPVVFVILVAGCGEGRVARLARELHGRYVRPQDLGEREADLLCRAQTAVTVVIGSEVNRTRLLDDVRNAVTLPVQLWEIAQTLLQVQELRVEHEEIPDRDAPRIAGLLAAQAEVLALATDSVTRRVGALEDYAAQAVAADDALRQWKTAQRLSMRNEDYQELLARTVRDELAVAQLAELTEEARKVEAALRASVFRARQAGLALVPETEAAS